MKKVALRGLVGAGCWITILGAGALIGIRPSLPEYLLVACGAFTIEAILETMRGAA